jgi:biopolymer transport protein ExbD
VQTAGQNEFTSKVEIGVSKEGTLTLDGRVVTEAELEALLAGVKRLNKDTPILVRADEVSQFGLVTRVWDTCRRLGLNKVVMQTRR